jgi:hypothetical protein
VSAMVPKALGAGSTTGRWSESTLVWSAATASDSVFVAACSAVKS